VGGSRAQCGVQAGRFSIDSLRSRTRVVPTEDTTVVPASLCAPDGAELAHAGAMSPATSDEGEIAAGTLDDEHSAVQVAKHPPDRQLRDHPRDAGRPFDAQRPGAPGDSPPLDGQGTDRSQLERGAPTVHL